MRLTGSTTALRNSKRLRAEMTLPEVLLWSALRDNDAGLRFRRQHPAGKFVLDFYCAPAKLAIEVDGEAHAMGDQPARDASRDTWLASEGVHVVRFRAADILMNLDGVVAQIITTAQNRQNNRQG